MTLIDLIIIGTTAGTAGGALVVFAMWLAIKYAD